MKVIDEKGRLFGKINLIDLLIALVILLVAAALCWKILGARAPGTATNQDDIIAANETLTVRYTVRCPDIDESYFADLAAYSEGAQLVQDSYAINGKIVEFREEPSYSTILDADGNPVEVADLSRSDAVFVLEYTGKMQENAIVVGQQIVRVGIQYTVRTAMVEIIGYITGVEIVTK